MSTITAGSNQCKHTYAELPNQIDLFSQSHLVKFIYERHLVNLSPSALSSQPHPVHPIQSNPSSPPHPVNLIQSSSSSQPHPVNLIQSNSLSQPNLVNLTHSASRSSTLPVNLIQSALPTQLYPSTSSSQTHIVDFALVILFGHPPAQYLRKPYGRKEGKKERRKEGRKEEARKEIQNESSGGGRTIYAALFFPLGFNEAAYKFEERYLQGS